VKSTVLKTGKAGMQEAEDEAIYAHHLQAFPSMDGCLHPDHSNNKSFPFVINN